MLQKKTRNRRGLEERRPKEEKKKEQLTRKEGHREGKRRTFMKHYNEAKTRQMEKKIQKELKR